MTKNTPNTPNIESFARIKVIGIGGSGKGALNHMITLNLKGVDFIAMNTDTQDLQNCLATKKIHIGKNLTKGLGAGMDPDIGRRSAEETKEEIQDALKGADIVFITGGMGGGTATGAAPVIAKIAKEEGILTVGIVTKPFFFEGQKRMLLAENGINELEKEVDALIIIPNDRLLSIIDKDTSVREAFNMVDEILRLAVDGIADIIKTTGTINLDFADIKRVLQDSGTALMGVGIGTGENRAVDAAKAAISSPLLDISINGAKGLLYAIYGNQDMSMYEVSEAAKIITESVDKDATIIFGIVHDDKMKKDEIKVVVIATKFSTDFKNKDITSPTYSTINSFEKPEPRIEKDNTSLKKAMNNIMNIKKKREEETSPETNNNEINNNILNIKDKKRNGIINYELEEKKKEEKLNPIFEDEEEDWALPPFLRRKK